MEKMGKDKQVGSSPSSASEYLNEVFGIKEPPSSSPTGIASIFAPPSSSSQRNPTGPVFQGYVPRYPTGSQASNTKQDSGSQDREGSNKEKKPNYQQRNEQPCPLSSSIYYGSQEDMYIRSSSTRGSASYTNSNKDGKEDNRYGNSTDNDAKWWEGSLYY